MMKEQIPLWRDAFQNHQDTRLFLDAVRSLAFLTTSSLETPVDLLNSIKCIILATNHELQDCKKNYKNILERDIDIKRRQHAVSFFNVLKNLQITCPEADAYYETVLLEPYNIIWHLDLLIHFHWQECFVQCAKQLPDDVMVYVCEQFLALESEPRTFSLYYIVLQCIIWKLFMLEDPQIATNETFPQFSFPFKLPKSVNQGNTFSHNEKLLQLYEILLNKLSIMAQSDQSKHQCAKLVLHAFKLILKLLSQVKSLEGSFVTGLFRLTEIQIECDILCSANNFCFELNERNSVYKEESAEVMMEYLILIVSSYCETVEKLLRQGNCCFSVLATQIECILTKVKKLTENSFLTPTSLQENPKVTALLQAVIENSFPCELRAAEIILKQPEILNSARFLEVLKNNKEVLQSEKNLTLLLNAAFLFEEKEPLVMLLFDVLSTTPEAVYYNILRYRIRCFGSQSDLKHPAFSSQSDQFVRKTLTYEKAEKVILPLLLQSPYEVLSTTVAQSLDQGKEGMDLIKVLKNVPEIIYESKPNLLTEIASYFSCEEPDTLKKLKHVHLIIKTVIIGSPVNLFENFLEICVIPYLLLTDKLEVILNCLNVALQNLEENEEECINREIFLRYIQKCGFLLNDCIASHRSKTKELIVKGMTLMQGLFVKSCSLSYEETVALNSGLKHCDLSVFVYMNKFLGNQVYEVLQSQPLELSGFLWTWCCFTKEDDFLQKCISETQFSNEDLLKVLTSVLPNFTKEEWAQSSLFIKENCKYLHSSLASSQKPWKLNESNFQLYATVRCLIDCISSILKSDHEDVTTNVTCSNFTNTVMNLLIDQETQPELFLYIFMDMCFLSNLKYFWKTFSSFMIAILRQTYQKSRDESQKKIFQALFTNILKQLPESQDKLALLEAL